MKLDDGSYTIFLSTKGENEEKVPPELVRFLKFVTADLEESEGDFQDGLVKQFQETIRNVKTDRKMGERYMIFEEMLREEKLEGRLEATKENILELIAAKAHSLCAFEEEAEKYLQSKAEKE